MKNKSMEEKVNELTALWRGMDDIERAGFAYDVAELRKIQQGRNGEHRRFKRRAEIND